MQADNSRPDSNWQELALILLHFSTFYLIVFVIFTFNLTVFLTTSLGNAFLRLIISFSVPLDDGTVCQVEID
jgi:hypothetical protein